jgi:hypothetical protein
LAACSAKATVTAGAETKRVHWGTTGEALGKVGGTVSIVNAPGGSVTSVVLAVESTFVENLRREDRYVLDVFDNFGAKLWFRATSMKTACRSRGPRICWGFFVAP